MSSSAHCKSREIFTQVRSAVTAAEHKNSQTELDAFRHAQPVQVAQERRDPIVLTTVVHQSLYRIEHGLQTIHQTPCDAVQCDAALVESRQNKRGDEGKKNRLADGATDAAYVTQSPVHTSNNVEATLSKQQATNDYILVCCLLLRQCCRFGQQYRSNVRLCWKDEISTQNSFDIVAVFGNKVERCFDIVAGVDRA